MRESQIALNTESVLDFLNNDKDIRFALKATREAGYQTLELWHVAKPENNASWKPFLQEADLGCCAIHELFEEVIEDVAATINKAHELQCPILAIGRSRDLVWEDGEEVKKFATKMNELGRACKEEGVRVLYHNHNSEFVRTDNRIALDIFFDETDPELVGSELDAYWVQLSGANPVKWCQKLGKRLGILHLKDVGIIMGPDGNFIKKPVCRTLGLGNLDLNAIIAAAEPNCSYYAVETCTDWIDNDSIRCAKESFEYLKDNFCD